MGTDVVNIGGIIIKNQAIELAQKLSSQFAQGTGDGLLGLAFGSINTVTPSQVQTPVENMISQDDIPKTSELFTVKLGSVKDANDPDKGESFYTFGYIDQAILGAQIPYYTPVDNSQGFWMFDSASAAVNGKTIARSGNKAIADTGTTLALVDDATCKAIYAAIPGSKYDSTQQGYIFPSDTSVLQLPVVSFAVGERQFVLQKEDLGFADAGNGMTYGGIQSRGDMTFDILGDVFLKSIYAVRWDSLLLSFNIIIHSYTMANMFSPIPDLRPRQYPLRRCPLLRTGAKHHHPCRFWLLGRVVSVRGGSETAAMDRCGLAAQCLRYDVEAWMALSGTGSFVRLGIFFGLPVRWMGVGTLGFSFSDGVGLGTYGLLDHE